MNKKSKREALEKLRARKEGRALSSRTEEFEVKENDIYEQMDEDEYQKLVEARREREDFVVDDGKSLIEILWWGTSLLNFLIFVFTHDSVPFSPVLFRWTRLS
jgi:hypothetical protein